MNDDLRWFGTRRPDRNYTERPGAYAMLVRDDRLLLVDEASGWLLPGGGIEAGELPVEALRRELFEETGYTVDDPEPVARIGQFAVSASGNDAYAKDCRLFRATPTDRPRSGDLETHWVSPERAAEALIYEGMQWVVNEYLR